MELFCLIEEYFHFLLVHIIHFRKVLERFRNVLRESIIITFPVECDVFRIHLNKEDHANLSCKTNILVLEVLLHHCPELGENSNAKASVILYEHLQLNDTLWLIVLGILHVPHISFWYS